MLPVYEELVARQHTILITGATGSIGGAAALALSKRGARVVLLGRSARRLDAKADSIRKALSDLGTDSQSGVIGTLIVDFSDFEAVRAAAEEALSRFPAFDGLVLSVGVFVQKGPHVLPSGHEVMFATNVMGPFLITQRLLERLQQPDGLVLYAIAPFHEDIDWDDLRSIDHHRLMTTFNRNKTCNRAIVGELARRYPGKILLSRVRSCVCHRQVGPRPEEAVADWIHWSSVANHDSAPRETACGSG